MKSPQNFATVISALSCSILLCAILKPSNGFQPQSFPLLPCNLESCRSKSFHSPFSNSHQFSRLGGRRTSTSRQHNDKMVWWRNNSNKQKTHGSLMVEASASAGERKKGLFDKLKSIVPPEEERKKIVSTCSYVFRNLIQLHYFARHKGCFDDHRSKKWG